VLETTLLYREIHEQPTVLTRLIAHERATAQRLADAIRQRGIRHVMIAARGTSANASRYAGYLFGALNGLTVAWATPSLFSVYQKAPYMADMLVIGISQSGQSPDIVSVVAEARKQGALTAVLTNNPASPLAAQGDYVFNLHAGEEKAVAATKTYTAQLATLALITAALAEESSLDAAINDIPQAVAEALKVNSTVAAAAPRYRYMERCVTVGRGYNYATAYELGLKMQELTYTITEPYSSAEFMHGPLAMIEEGFPVIVIAPSGLMVSELQGLLRTLRESYAELVTISDDAETLAWGHVQLPLPHGVPEWLSPITAIVPGQLLAMHLAHARHYNVDAPRAIQKVTKTV
jgi:glucosamine--fructose-6-phosphate aminotransferase (isomerizing)